MCYKNNPDVQNVEHISGSPQDTDSDPQFHEFIYYTSFDQEVLSLTCKIANTSDPSANLIGNPR